MLIGSDKKRVPRDEEVLGALAEFRANDDNKTNAKRIMKSILASHADWKLTHARMVKVLKQEGKPRVDPDEIENMENDRLAANKAEFTLFSPGECSPDPAIFCMYLFILASRDFIPPCPVRRALKFLLSSRFARRLASLACAKLFQPPRIRWRTLTRP